MGLTFVRCRDASGPLMDAAMALYRRSFPAHELRLWPDQQAVMNDPLYHFDLCLLDGALAGLILYWDFGAYISMWSISASSRPCAATVWVR